MPGGRLGLSSLGSEGGGSLKMFSLQLMCQSGVRVKYPKKPDKNQLEKLLAKSKNLQKQEENDSWSRGTLRSSRIPSVHILIQGMA